MTRKKSLVFFPAFFIFTASSAFADLLVINVEPIVGYEQVQQVLPTPHRINRLIYGARATGGILLISAEAEYTHGVAQESFPNFSQTDTGDQLKVGLRSGFSLGPLLTLSVRGGVQASQEKIDQTSNGVTTTTFQPVAYNPYLGLAARAMLTSHLSASAGVVAIIPNINDMSQNEYQMTAGFAIRFP